MKKFLPYIIIAIILLLAGGFYLDRTKKGSSPSLSDAITKDEPASAPELKKIGTAPDFVGGNAWLNSDPLSSAALKGKVVLVDFWTYSCINCIRTLPYITKWYETYKDQGLVVVGVHTPEFAFEKEKGNVQAALKRFGITYPVVQDNDYQIWKAYSNRYWPAHYLIDKNGDIVYTHFGEGNYVETENAIRELLGQEVKTEKEAKQNSDVRTPEIYFGLSRLENLTDGQKASTSPEKYVMPNRIDENTFALQGKWQYSNEAATLIEGPGKIKLYFYAKAVHIVASSKTSQSITAKVDGFPAATIQISDPSLYTLFEGNTAGGHVIEISIPNGGFEAFTFTFG
jgi:thiol-disulfide isomerase/thioredoxin